MRAVEQVHAGQSPETVIRTLGFSRSCIYTWLARYRTGGWDGLKVGTLTGRPMKITPRQLRWLYTTVTQKNPLQFRFEFALWTRQMLWMLLRERFGLRLSLSSVGRLLVQLGLSCQRPLYRAIAQDPARVARWRREEFPAIQALAQQARATIWFGDEGGVRSDYHAGTTWGVRGQMRFMVREGRVTAAVFREFLHRLLHGATRPIYLILDAHSVHTARVVRDFVATCKGRLRLFFLPPYSPELNPDEQVWNHVKHHGVGRAFIRGKAELKAYVQTLLHRIQKSPLLIQMFFLLPDTRYAAS